MAESSICASSLTTVLPRKNIRSWVAAWKFERDSRTDVVRDVHWNVAIPGRHQRWDLRIHSNRAPAPAGRLNPDLPPKLDEMVGKCLEKDRNLRYQHSADIRQRSPVILPARELGGWNVVLIKTPEAIHADSFIAMVEQAAERVLARSSLPRAWGK